MISLQKEDFSVGSEYEKLQSAAEGDAVILTFVGRVRDFSDQGSLASVMFEHYPGMTEKSLLDIIIQARQRWSLGKVHIIHRIGELSAGEQIVFIGVSSQSHQDAFAACEYLVDFLKHKAPLWRKEVRSSGSRWI